VTPIGFILLVWLMRGQSNLHRLMNTLLWLVAAGIAISLPLWIQNQPMRSLDLPRGRVALRSDYYSSFLWWSQQTHPGDSVFTASGTEILFPMALRNPAEVRYVTNTDFTRPEQVRDVLAVLERQRVRFVLWDSSFDVDAPMRSRDAPVGLMRASIRRCFRAVKTILGGDFRPSGDHLGPLRDYLHLRYHIVKLFPGSLEVWERN